ncbi:MAG: tetratricopeptide repeat protein [Polyangiaceae bacterium]|nr:tetratricopeptide repeat protein [Polyangiaceae bacterium]
MIDLLRAELERLFDLDQLLELSRSLLEFDPTVVGGASAIASYAEHLARFAVDQDALPALVDAVMARRGDAAGKLAEVLPRRWQPEPELHGGDSVGSYLVVRRLDPDRIGTAYLARHEGAEVRLLVVHPEVTRDQRGRQRFLVAQRLLTCVQHPSLPQRLRLTIANGHLLLAQDYVEGQTLSARLGRAGPMHINEGRPILRALLEALAELHTHQLVHGTLGLDGVLLTRDGDSAGGIRLLGAGAHLLLGRAIAADRGDRELPWLVAHPDTVAPEQLRGREATPTSDVYAFGALAYELLSGVPPFGAEGGVAAAVGHLSNAPATPSTVAPRGWIPHEIDEFLLRLLAKDPADRPADATDVLDEFEQLGRTGTRTESQISDAEFDERVDQLLADPTVLDHAVALEAAVDAGADASRVAEALQMAADQIGDGADPPQREAKQRLLFRAARMYEAAREPIAAEPAYLAALALDPNDGPTRVALESLRRRLGKFEELVEMLLDQSDRAQNRGERARALAEIGRLYVKELDDREQALVAFTQAYCEDPRNDECAGEIETLAGTEETKWSDVLSACMTATMSETLDQESKNLLYSRMADWYLTHVKRPDLALPVYQAILEHEPSNDAALRGLTQIYRKAQQWPELGMVLTTRADAAATPALARDLRAEAAEILEVQLNDTGGARDLYEGILREDPGHARASEALGRIYDRTNDHEGVVKILERRAEAEHGEERRRTLCRIAEIFEDRLKDDGEAIRRYDVVLDADPDHLDALRSLDRLLAKAGRYRELLANLDRQIRLAATPRQKISLWERVAQIQDDEFLDHPAAAAAWEAILEIDGAHEGALIALPRHYRVLDRWEELVALYERHANLVEDPRRGLDLHLARGRVLLEQLASPERAMAAFEAASAIDPQHAGALEAVARVRESLGDAEAAIHAIDALAERATSPEGKTEQYLRAARLLESRGDRDSAIEYYKRALDQVPSDLHTSVALRSAYIARGDINAAIQLLDREFARTEGDATKARLAAEVAVLCRDRLKDDARAEEAAKRSLQFDPTNIDARAILGDLAFEAQRPVEASRHYEVIADRTDTLAKERATRILLRYVDALSQTGSTEKALAPMDSLLRIAPDDADALERVAQVTFEHGAPKRAVELYRDLFAQFGDEVGSHPESLYRYGESLRRTGDLEAAIRPLEEASDLDPSSATPLVSLARIYEAQSDWERVTRTKTRHLDIAEGDTRTTLLIEIGEIATEKLGDRTRAAKSYVAALEERPDDRRLLTKLMQLYSEEQDWEKLVDVVEKLAEFVDERQQKAKYLQTAAIVTSRQMRDFERALDFYRQVIELDPTNEKAIDEAIELERVSGRFESVEELLKRKVEHATAANDKPRMLAAFVALAELYENELMWIDKAIDAYEAAQTLEPQDTTRAEKLADLYASDPERYLAKAVESQIALLRQNPYRAEPYKLLRRLYTETKHADAAWCLCQGLHVLNLAEPDEERFYKRMRSDTAAPAREALTDDDWLRYLMHEDADPFLTSVFALIEPAVIGSRSRSLADLGYDPHYQVDIARHPYPMSQNLYYAAGVIGVDPPPTYQNPNDPAGLSFLHAHTPSVVLGRAAMATEIPPQAAAFIAARHLAYFRPGMYVRHLVATGTGLKAWLFAALKLISPQFPIAPELEGPVKEAYAALDAGIQGQARDHLARIVAQLIQSGGALDLKRWVAGVDLTADRVGLLVAHDLDTVIEILRASDESASAVAAEERLRQLVLFSISHPYFDLRRKLGIAVDS